MIGIKPQTRNPDDMGDEIFGFENFARLITTVRKILGN